jgi:hypothetical protein
MTNNSNSSTYVTDASRKASLIWFVVFIVVGFLIVAVNLATILTFIIHRHLRRRRSMFCLINLAVADMLAGVLSVALILILLGENIGLTYHNGILHVSFFFETSSNLTIVISVFSLVLVSLERVYATFFPFRHRTTRLRQYIFAVSITWLLPLPMVVTFHLIREIVGHIVIFTSMFVIYLLCLIIICVSYTAIFLNVKIQAKISQPNQQLAAIQIRRKREQHLAMTLFVVTVLFLITWLPYIIVVVIKWHTSYIVSHDVKLLADLMQFINSFINPIIYVFRMKDFRKALSQMIFKCSRDRQGTHPLGHHGNHCREHQPPIELRVM